MCLGFHRSSLRILFLDIPGIDFALRRTLCFSCSPRLISDEREVPEKNIYASSVYILANDLLPWPEGKICADRSLKVPEFNKGDRSVGITDKRSAGYKGRLFFRNCRFW